MINFIRLLAATRSSDKSERTQAEEQLDGLIQSTGGNFLTTLIEIASDPRCDVADSQSALLVVKNGIMKYWSPGFENFSGPPLSHDARERIRVELLKLLGKASNAKTRSACALVIGRIGSLEYPDQWPNLVDQAVQYLNSGTDPAMILGGLVLFKELLVETFREEDFMVCGESILQRLLEICQLPNSDESRLMAIECFHECITFLLMGDDDQLPHLEHVAERFIPQWCELFVVLLQQELGDSRLITEIVNSIRELDSAFPQVLESHLPQLFYVVEKILIATRDSMDDELKSNLAFLLDIALQNQNVRPLCFDSREKLDIFVSLLLNLSILSDELAEWWVEDYNEFVTAELELNTGELNPRTNAGTLVAMTSKPEILARLLDLLHEAVSGEPSPQVEEACLFLISSLITQVNIDKHLVGINMERFQQFLSVLSFVGDTSDGHSRPHVQLLIVRKIITSAVVAKYAGPFLQDGVKLQLATHAFQAPMGDVPVVRIAQLKSIIDGAPCFPDAFRNYQNDCWKIIANLIEDAEDDTPVFLAEVFGATLKLDYEVVSRDGSVIDMLFALAAKDTADIDLNAQILDIVGELLDTVSSRSIVDHILKPVFATIQKSEPSGFEYSGDLYFALDLATSVFEHQDVEFSGEEREQMLQSFYQVITSTEDPQILQVTSFAYAALVQNIHTQINPDVATNVLKVAAQLLNPSLDDSAALASGKLVKAIINQFGDELGSTLCDLIDASARRLAAAENALLVETLVLVFCELTLRNAPAVIEILSNSGMLEAVMKQWIPTFEVVRGADEIFKNIKALQLLFDANDTRLNGLLLPDEPIRNTNEILTRRKARNLKFTQIPLPLKILKLLVRELLQAPQPTASDSRHVKSFPLNDSISDDEWDDELALNDGGDVVDLRTYTIILEWFRKLSSESSAIEWLNQLSLHEKNALSDCLNN